MPADEEKRLAFSANKWLADHGDPCADGDGSRRPRRHRLRRLWRSRDLYVIDKAGVIRMKHTGPITPEVLGKKIMPLLAELGK